MSNLVTDWPLMGLPDNPFGFLQAVHVDHLMEISFFNAFIPSHLERIFFGIGARAIPELTLTIQVLSDI